MGVFGKETSTPTPTDTRVAELTDEIRKLSRAVAELRGENEALEDRRVLLNEKLELTAEIEQLKIERERMEEGHARKVREVEHATGLHRKQSEWERTKAVEEATIAVQKGNLDAERTRFEEQLAFHKTQIKNEVDRLDGLLKGLMDRLPTVTVEKAISIRSGAGNGNGDS